MGTVRKVLYSLALAFGLASALVVHAQTTTYSINQAGPQGGGGSQIGSSPQTVCTAWAATLIYVSPFTGGCGTEVVSNASQAFICGAKSTDNRQPGCFNYASANINSTLTCAAGQTLVNGNCRAANTSICAGRNGTIVNGFVPGSFDQLNAKITSGQWDGQHFQRDGCTYELTASGKCIQNGEQGLCVTAVANGLRPGDGSAGGGPASQPMIADIGTANRIDKTATSAATQAAGPTGGTGGTNTGFNTLDAANLGKITTNTATGIEAIDAGTNRTEQSLKQLDGRLKSIKDGQCGGTGQPVCATSASGGGGTSTTITGQCGAPGQPACVVTDAIGDQTANQSAIDGKIADQNSKTDARGNSLKDGNLPTFGSDASRWRATFEPFLGNAPPACNIDVMWSFSVGAVHIGDFNIGPNICQFGPWIQGFLYFAFGGSAFFYLISLAYRK